MPDLSISIKNSKKRLKDTTRVLNKAEGQVKKIVKDVGQRIASIEAQEVSRVYNISKQEVLPLKKNKAGKWVGQKIKMQGKTLEDFRVVYQGKRKTIADFGMKPKTPPKKRQERFKRLPGVHFGMPNDVVMARPLIPYDVTVMIKKGDRRKVTGNVFVASNRNNAAGIHTKYIPFKRYSDKRLDINTIKSVSIPQMIRTGEVMTVANKRIDATIEQRIKYYMQKWNESPTR